MTPHYEVLIATPANSFTPGYVKSLLATTHTLDSMGIAWHFLNANGSHVGVARERTISGDDFYANNRITVPYNGALTYDKVLWIDSDISWTVDDFFKVYESEHDIVSGAYMMADRVIVASKQPWGGLMSQEEFHSHKEPFKVASVGFGYICVRSGVFESLAKPWFAPPPEVDRFLIGEDVAWCIKARKAGYDIWLDPSVRVDHQKTVIVDWGTP